jgi:hypothetical protein
VHGNRLTNSTCAPVAVALGANAVIEVPAPLQNPMTVRVHQPDGTTLTRTVAIP